MSETEPMRNCPNCGKSIKAAATRCVWCFEKSKPIHDTTSSAASQPDVKLEINPKAASSPDHREIPGSPDKKRQDGTSGRYASCVERRYQDAYAMAHVIVEQGHRLKAIAVVAAALLAVITLLAALRAGGLDDHPCYSGLRGCW